MELFKRLLFLFLLMGMTATNVNAHNFEAKNDDGITIYYLITSSKDLTVAVSYQGMYSFQYSNEYSGSVKIPSMVTYGGKTYSVTSIGDNAFRDCTGLTSIDIPNSVTSIGNSSFNGCTGLTSVTFGNSVTSIGEFAFYDCSGLTSVEIPNSMTSIGDSAFEGCTGLTFVTIPNSVTSISNCAFWGCSGLTSITIPNSVTSIGVGAFFGCSGLTSVTILKSVTSIGSGAFAGCAGLNSIIVERGNSKYDSRENCNAIIETASNTLIAGCKITTIPNSVTSIGENAFSGCTGLTSVTILKSVTSIGSGAFAGCAGLNSIIVERGNSKYDSRENCNAIIETASNTLIAGCKITTIPNSVTSIGENAFLGCIGLTSVIIPNSVERIGESAFRYCSGLTSVTIGNSVESIGESAFYDCSGLTSVTIGNSVTSIGEGAFQYCSSLTSVEIPNSVTEIGDNAFWGCSGLTSVTIGNSVESIGDYAFEYCTGLKQIISKCATPPTCNNNTFNHAPQSTCVLMVPQGSLTAYKNASYWKEFVNIQEFSSDMINTLSMKNLKAFKNKQVILPIALNNEDEISGFQFDLFLPTGISVATKANGKMMISTTERMDGNYTISSNQMGSFVRIVGYSVDGDAFIGTEGDILNIALNISEEIAEGDNIIYIKSIVLSDVNNTEYHPADIQATLTIKSIGDVDDSGAININDVVCIINYILNRSTGTFIEGAADVDENGTININDVVVLINKYILHKDAAPQQDEMRVPLRAVSVDNNYLHLADIEINPGETKEIQLLMTNADVVTASQGNIKLPAGLSFVTKSNGKVDAKNIDSRSEDFTLSCAIQADGSLTFAQYSGDGFNYDGNSGGIFTFKIKADENATAGTYSINLSNVVLSIGGVGYDIPNRSSQITISGATGIDSIGYEELLEGNIYTLDGKKVEQLHRGVNIVRHPDGSVRKVVVK